ncbi:MAG: type II secretion system protein GspG [Aureliella sp.]
MKSLKRQRPMRKSLRRSAFTLLEVMLVLVILAAIAGIAVVNLGTFQDRAFEKIAKTDISGLKQSLEAYRLEVGQYPTQLNDLHEQPSDLADPNKWMQVRKDPIKPDPWGNEYEYENNGADFVITSGGPNGKIGDEDDISSKTS